MSDYMQPIDEHRDGIPRHYKAPADERAMEYPSQEGMFMPIPLYGYCPHDIVRETTEANIVPEPLASVTGATKE
jgi:hypothetical protein